MDPNLCIGELVPDDFGHVFDLPRQRPACERLRVQGLNLRTTTLHKCAVESHSSCLITSVDLERERERERVTICVAEDEPVDAALHRRREALRLRVLGLGLGFGVLRFGFRGWGVGFRVWGVGFKGLGVTGLGTVGQCEVSGLGFKI